MLREPGTAVVLAVSLCLALFYFSSDENSGELSEGEPRSFVAEGARQLRPKEIPFFHDSLVHPSSFFEQGSGLERRFRFHDLRHGNSHWDMVDANVASLVADPDQEEFKLTGRGIEKNDKLFVNNNKTPEVISDNHREQNRWVFVDTLQPGERKNYTFRRERAGSPNQTLELTVIRSAKNRPLHKIEVSNSYYSPITDGSSPQRSTIHKVYDRFLRIAGQGADLEESRLEFHVYRTMESGEHSFIGMAELIGESPRRGDHSFWISNLKLPDSLFPPERGRVVPVAIDRDGTMRVGEAVAFVLSSEVNRQLAPTDLAVAGAKDDPTARPQGSRILLTTSQATIQATTTSNTGWVVFRVNGGEAIPADEVKASGKSFVWTAKKAMFVEGRLNRLVAHHTIGSPQLMGAASAPLEARVRTSGPQVVGVRPANLSLAENGKVIRVQFNRENPIDKTNFRTKKSELASAFSLSAQTGVTKPTGIDSLSYDENTNEVLITFTSRFPPGVYELQVVANEHLKDIYGHAFADDSSTIQLIRPIEKFDEPTIRRGIGSPTGPYVEFPEYAEPRDPTNGFNPSDRVETRVVRLYYFRDAHRVAQIINRNAKSYNGAAIELQQRMAERSRAIADEATDDRRSKERQAVEDAKKTREAENELRQADQLAQRSAQEAAAAQGEIQALSQGSRPGVSDSQRDQRVNSLKSIVNKLENVASSARQRAADARARVQELRAAESRSHEHWQKSIAVEDRAREEHFRREVAAATADPDTYAPGDPKSIDPVRRVSVSVIGEGLIQLRGPINGLNVVRIMINQIDAPVGQVRVGVHTVQINGEHGDKMEIVAERIQRFIDHSRFLTLQSAEMLRKSIVQVAAQRASSLGGLHGMTQAERDRKYLDAFFGRDFIHELDAMDSEFLRTGNKLLSLHSMNTTSLASAMFIMALAKNSTRMEILQVFEGMMQTQLPMAEENYFAAGLTCDGKKDLFAKYCRPEEFQLLSQNARFQSIRGFFDGEIGADDTMTPIQREFVRLAQIFKQRLVTEMELRQRIMERSIIEERLGDTMEQLRVARDREKTADLKLQRAQVAFRDAQKELLGVAQTIQVKIGAWENDAEFVARSIRELDTVFQMRGRVLDELRNVKLLRAMSLGVMKDYDKDEAIRIIESVQTPPRYSIRNWDRWIADYLRRIERRLGKNRGESLVSVIGEFGFPFIGGPDSARISVKLTSDDKELHFQFSDSASRLNLEQLLDAASRRAFRAEQLVSQLKLPNVLGRKAAAAKKLQAELEFLLEKFKDKSGTIPDGEVLGACSVADEMARSYDSILKDVVSAANGISLEFSRLLGKLAQDPSQIDLGQVNSRWLQTQQRLESYFGDELKASMNPILTSGERAFQRLTAGNVDFKFAQKDAEAARRPLDHKKFLDMLVDEMEDEYIELLEGTRAHTANIDAYIKRLMTALDDDFNTQFYYPTFRKVRHASQAYDVTLGQVETTTVLANNRAFAKVSPQATMEFDLPKRDILISEAMNGAKAMMSDFGGLLQDPSFLGLSSLNSGQSAATQMGGASGGRSTVRNVLPGLSTDSAESVMSQQGPGGNKFGAAMEALIPDPAIYKFETGTGFEIRPIIQPDGQSLVFNFNYMYTTNVREPVRADEKHLGRVKRHFVHTDVQLSNFELREVSRYTVALKASRTARGVPLFENLPGVGVLFRPAPSDESSLQQNVILGQSTIFPTLFDLMGLRWAPVVADLDPLRLSNSEFLVRNRRRVLMNRVFDHSSHEVDRFLRIPEGERRMDLYRSQESIPRQHPNGYIGPGANIRRGTLQEGPPTRPSPSMPIPGRDIEGSRLRTPRPPLFPSGQIPSEPGFQQQPGLQQPANGIYHHGGGLNQPTPAHRSEIQLQQPDIKRTEPNELGHRQNRSNVVQAGYSQRPARHRAVPANFPPTAPRMRPRQSMRPLPTPAPSRQQTYPPTPGYPTRPPARQYQQRPALYR